MTIATNVFNNLSKGRVDHDLNGRFELPLYSNGLDYSVNFNTNFKGSLIFRSGNKLIDDTDEARFVEFKFSNNQNYLLVLTNLKMRFLSFDANNDIGWVLDGSSNILELTTPWTIAQVKEIISRESYSQNYDAMIFCHSDLEPRKLIRNSANSFTLRVYSRKDDPFPLTWAAAKTITAVTKATTAQVTITAHGYSVGDRVKISGISGMTELNSWTAAVLTTPTADTFTIDVDTSSFIAYSSGGSSEKVSTGSYPKTCAFSKGRLNYTRGTTTFLSESGQYFIHTLPASVLPASAIQRTLSDTAQDIEWMIGVDAGLISGQADSIISITGGGNFQAITSDTMEANVTSAPGAYKSKPLLKDGLLFYVGLDRRNLYYFQYDALTETFKAQDANVFALDASRPLLKKVRSKKDRNDLIYCLMEDGSWATLNINIPEKILAWLPHETDGEIQDIAVISDNDGNQKLFSIVLRSGVYYIEQEADIVEFSQRESFFTDVKADDDSAFIRKLSDELTECIYVDNAEIVSDLRTATITYDSNAATITAGTASFSSGDIGKHIVYKTSTGYEYGRFEITGYTSTTVVTVSVLQTPHANTYASWYLTFSSISGLTRFNGLEVNVVGDGAFIDSFTVSAGAIALEKQVCVAVIGLAYTGVAKTFPLGVSSGSGTLTQAKPKSIASLNVRAISTVGGKFGASRYNLDAIQDIRAASLNYLPAIPIDRTARIVYSDSPNVDRACYFVQDIPGPMHITAAMLEVNYV